MKYGKKQTPTKLKHPKLEGFIMNLNLLTTEKKFGIEQDGGQQEEPFFGHKVFIIEKV